VYIWGNIGRRSRSGATRARGQDFLKWRRLDGRVDWSGGHVFVFNNTLLPPVDDQNRGFKELYGEDPPGESIRNWCVWNNVVHNDQDRNLHNPDVAFDDPNGLNNDIRNNLFGFGWRAGKELTPPSGNQDARPVYAANSWNPETGIGTFLLAEGPGYAQGISVPGVFDDIIAPDCGAHQHSRPRPVGYGHLNMPRRRR
jgi:hypothetical protein